MRGEVRKVFPKLWHLESSLSDFCHDSCEIPGHGSSKISLIFFECDVGAAEYQT